MKIYVRASLSSEEYNQAFSADRDTRHRWARDTDDRELLEVYLYDPNGWVRSAVAYNPNTPPDILKTYIMNSDGNDYSTSAAVESSNFTLQDALEIAEDVTNKYAINSMVHKFRDSRELLDILLPKAPYYTLSWLAGLAKTPVDILEELSHNSNPKVRGALLKNRRLPDHILAELLEDPEVSVDVVKYFKKHPDKVTPELMASLADSNSKKVRMLLCDFPNLPEDIQIKLSKDRLCDVRAIAARKFNLPEEDFVRLTNDRSDYVRYSLLSNPYIPDSIFAPFALGRARSGSYDVWRILHRDHIPGEVLEMISHSSSWWDRKSVAEHPDTPDSVLRTLARDSTVEVSNAARVNLSRRGLA